MVEIEFKMTDSGRDGNEDLWSFLNEVSQQLEVLLDQRDKCFGQSAAPSTSFEPTYVEHKVRTSDIQITASQPIQAPIDWKMDGQLVDIQSHAIYVPNKTSQVSHPEAHHEQIQVQQVEISNPGLYGGNYCYRVQQSPHELHAMEYSNGPSYYQQQYPQLSNSHSSQALVDCAYCDWIAKISSSQSAANNYLESA